jgi:hypothetical protein
MCTEKNRIISKENHTNNPDRHEALNENTMPHLRDQIYLE